MEASAFLAERGIPKPAFNDFALLHRLAEMRLDREFRLDLSNAPQRRFTGNCSVEFVSAGGCRFAKDCDVTF